MISRRTLHHETNIFGFTSHQSWATSIVEPISSPCYFLTGNNDNNNNKEKTLRGLTRRKSSSLSSNRWVTLKVWKSLKDKNKDKSITVTWTSKKTKFSLSSNFSCYYSSNKLQYPTKNKKRNGNDRWDIRHKWHRIPTNDINLHHRAVGGGGSWRARITKTFVQEGAETTNGSHRSRTPQ